MKIFTQEVNNCNECNFFDKEFTECNYTDEAFEHFDNEGEEIFREYEDIHKTCPFNKSLTKEDIESFGFKFKSKSIDDWYERLGEYETNNENPQRFYKLQLHINRDNLHCFIDAIDIDNTEYSVFKGYITSKPHLEFILQTLNIIK